MTSDHRPRILIVEDEAKTASTVALYLRRADMAVEVAMDGADGLERARSGAFDLLILDVMLPGVDGRQICRTVRTESSVPILLVTARATEEDRIEGLDLGADDYVTKPFSPRELVARVRANLRRATREECPSPSVLCRGPLVIDRARREARIEGRSVPLTPAELELLGALAERPGVVWSRHRLTERLPGAGAERSERTIDAHVKNLRAKLEPDRHRPRFVVTVFGAGYKLSLPERDA